MDRIHCADYIAHLESCSVYSNSNSALRREIARLKERLEEKDEEITLLQARLDESLRNNERNELRYRSSRAISEYNVQQQLPPPWWNGPLIQDTMNAIRFGCKFLVKSDSVFGNIAVYVY